MGTRIVEIDEYIVIGDGLKGAFSEIRNKWNRLNMKIGGQGIIAKESFGVCVSIKGRVCH